LNPHFFHDLTLTSDWAARSGPSGRFWLRLTNSERANT